MTTLTVLAVCIGLLLFNLAVNIITDWAAICGLKSKINDSLNRATLYLHDPLKGLCFASVAVGFIQLAMWLHQ